LSGRSLAPWRDRAGRVSILKLVTFSTVLAPGAWLVGSFLFGTLGPKPVAAAIDETGLWAIRALLLTLAVSPLRRAAAWPGLILVRRMLGLAALAYALAHLVLYALDQAFDLVLIASELVLRFYLAVGFAALLGLGALGATSTDRAVRRLGAGWHRLHRTVYAITGLALLHMAVQSATDVTECAIWSGILGLLMGYRALNRYGLADRSWCLAALAIAAALGTAGFEAVWYGLTTGIPAGLVLAANLDPAQLRPADGVLAFGLCLAALAALRGTRPGALQHKRGRRPATAPASS
jgi:sulfoxide reductase heme-binding subunit YedZ